ncbi:MULTISPECIES: hypothetical protein [unclassified Kitasatospora]|uniref:hypothetical protein n=1 Tax=unclassified Kitasatospora TaxID=2633591 RepID=UPI00382C29EE
MFRSTGPRDFRIPSSREVAEDFGEPIAVLRQPPGEWFTLLGRQNSNGFLCHLDVNYHVNKDLVAIVQTSRPVPESHRVKSLTTPETQLQVFLANSDRLGPGPYRGRVITPDSRRTEVRLDGVAVAVDAYSAEGCTSARLPHGAGYLIVTAPDEHWALASDLALRPPAAF